VRSKNVHIVKQQSNKKNVSTLLERSFLIINYVSFHTVFHAQFKKIFNECAFIIYFSSLCSTYTISIINYNFQIINMKIFKIIYNVINAKKQHNHTLLKVWEKWKSDAQSCTYRLGHTNQCYAPQNQSS